MVTWKPSSTGMKNVNLPASVNTLFLSFTFTRFLNDLGIQREERESEDTNLIIGENQTIERTSTKHDDYLTR